LQTDISADEATLAPLGPEPNPAIVIDSAESIAGGNWGDEVLHPSTDRRGGWGYPVRERARTLFELMTPMPYTNLRQMLDGAAAWGIMCYEKRLFLDDLSDDVIRAFEEHFHRKNSPLSVVPIQLLRAAYARVGDDETAFAGRRDLERQPRRAGPRCRTAGGRACMGAGALGGPAALLGRRYLVHEPHV
jgi:hypothetical protein